MCAVVELCELKWVFSYWICYKTMNYWILIIVMYDHDWELGFVSSKFLATRLKNASWFIIFFELMADY